MCTTAGHTQLPGRGVANVGSFGYLSGNTTSERSETATAHTGKALGTSEEKTTTMENLLHKDKKENKEKAPPQKQECGCPSLQPSLRSHPHAFLSDPPAYCEGFAILTDN